MCGAWPLNQNQHGEPRDDRSLAPTVPAPSQFSLVRHMGISTAMTTCQSAGCITHQAYSEPQPTHGSFAWWSPAFSDLVGRLGKRETELRIELKKCLVLFKYSRRAPAGGHITQESVSAQAEWWDNNTKRQNTRSRHSSSCDREWRGHHCARVAKGAGQSIRCCGRWTMPRTCTFDQKTSGSSRQ